VLVKHSFIPPTSGKDFPDVGGALLLAKTSGKDFPDVGSDRPKEKHLGKIYQMLTPAHNS
jgi:hypothetical protein